MAECYPLAFIHLCDKNRQKKALEIYLLCLGTCVVLLLEMCFLLLKQAGLLLLVKRDVGFVLFFYLLCILLRSPLPAVFWSMPVSHR